MRLVRGTLAAGAVLAPPEPEHPARETSQGSPELLEKAGIPGLRVPVSAMDRLVGGEVGLLIPPLTAMMVATPRLPATGT